MTKKNPIPVATGTFTKTPFAHMLIHILERRLQGTLHIQDDKDRMDIYFREGSPAKVDTTRGGRRLGETLMEMGKLTAKQLRDSVEEMKKTGELHGQVLVRLGFIDGATLVAGITDQMIRKMVDAFIMHDAAYAFYEGVNLIQAGSAELVSVDTFALLMTGVRFHGDAMQLNPVVNTLRDRSFYLPDAESLGRYKFTRDERALCKRLLETPQDLDMLRKWDVLDKDTIKRVLYVLVITRALKVVTREKVEEIRRSLPPIRFDSQAPPPVEKKSYPPEVQALRDDIQQRAAAISSQTCYEMLGVDKEADASTVRTAFFRLAKKYHPDRAAKEGLDDLRETLAYLFANLSEAHNTLTDLDLKEGYDESLKRGAPMKPGSDPPPETEEEKQVRMTLEAASLFQKALVIMKQSRLEEAFQMIDKALTNCPDDGEYMAAHAWLRVQLNKVRPKDVINLFREAEKKNPNSERVHFFFARVLMGADHVNEAKQQFQKTLEINPRNIEAAREIRIIEMRVRNTGKHKKPNLLNMFRK